MSHSPPCGVCIKDYERVPELESGLTAYFWFYDEERLHQSLDLPDPWQGQGQSGGIHGGLKRQGHGGLKGQGPQMQVA